MHLFYCLLLFICSYFALVITNCFTGQVKSLCDKLNLVLFVLKEMNVVTARRLAATFRVILTILPLLLSGCVFHRHLPVRYTSVPAH